MLLHLATVFTESGRLSTNHTALNFLDSLDLQYQLCMPHSRCACHNILLGNIYGEVIYCNYSVFTLEGGSIKFTTM